MGVWRKYATADGVMVVLASLGIASGLGLFVAHGLDVDGIPGFGWMAGIALCTVALAAGLLVRSTHPLAATGLLIVGAATPIVAWYHLWYWYPLGVAIAVMALATMPRSTARPARPGMVGYRGL